MLESTSTEGFVAKHIERYGEGIQHVGVEVDNIKGFVEHLLSKDVKSSGYKEIEGVRKEVLAGARNAFGIILQVFEWIGNYKEALPEERMIKVWRNESERQNT